MTDSPSVKCRVCGAANPAGSGFCESCGVKLEAAPSKVGEGEVDKLLEELIEVTPTPPEGEAAAGEEKELVDELLDSLLIEGEEKEEQFECPICKTILPMSAEVCTQCGAKFEVEEVPAPPEEVPPPPPEMEEAEVPVAVSFTEEEPSKIRTKSGRLIDITVLGTIVTMIAIFALGGMYSSANIVANPASLIAFILVAIIGTFVGILLLRMSTSAVAQGDKLVKEGSYQDAIYYYDKAIRMGSKPASAWASKGVALKRMGKLEEALHSQNVALKLDPKNEIAWCNKGDIYFKLGKLKKAIECFDKAIDLKPKYAIAWNNKGAALALAKKFKAAKECHDKAVQLKPKYVAAWLNRGEVYARLGLRDEAKLCLDKAKALGA